MNIINQETQLEQDFEPIKGSIVILAFKLLFTLILFEGLYIVLFVVLQVVLKLPFDWHHHISIGLLIAGVVKIIFELSFILYLFLQWAGNSYYMRDKHIIKKVGILSSREEVYHYDNIRTISIEQTFLGKLFHYGDITLKTSAPGGYQEDIVFSNIDNPQKYEKKLKGMFSQTVSTHISSKQE